MAHTPKIATCSYCGTRAALVLGEGRHELACSACGAPLHEMKALRPDVATSKRDSHSWDGARPDRMAKPEKNRKLRKKKKSPLRRALGELFDVVEDIFD